MIKKYNLLRGAWWKPNDEQNQAIRPDLLFIRQIISQWRLWGAGRWSLMELDQQTNILSVAFCVSKDVSIWVTWVQPARDDCNCCGSCWHGSAQDHRAGQPKSVELGMHPLTLRVINLWGNCEDFLCYLPQNLNFTEAGEKQH